MNKQITSTIKDLIMEYNYVTVPQLGGFVSNYKAAEILSEDGVILPPSKQLSFNADLSDDDGLLVKRLALVSNQTVQKAQKAVAHFVQNIFIDLDKGKSVTMDKIGVLKYNKNLCIEFVADDSENLNPHAYGMVSTACVKLEKTLTYKEQQYFISRKTLIRAAVIIPFLLVGSLLSIHLNQIGFFQTSVKQMASLIDWTDVVEEPAVKQTISEEAANNKLGNPVEKAIEERTKKNNALDYVEPQPEKHKALEEAKVTSDAQKTVKVKETEKRKPKPKLKHSATHTTENNQLKKYQLVAGSFKSEDNARRLAHKITTKQNLSPIVVKRGHRYRVIAASFVKKQKAKKFQKELKSQSISTWINID